MKKFNKYISLAVVAVVGVGMATSCDDSKDNDFVQEYEGPSGVYFSNNANSYLELDSASNTISYPVYRDVAGEELTVAINVSPVANYQIKDIYTFPEAVTFPAGSKEAPLVIGYDISKAAMGMEQQYTVTLDAEPNPFSSNTVVITLVNPAPWNLIGTNGKFFDYYWGATEDYSPGPITVSVWQEELNKNHYRISNPYIELNGDENSYFEFYVLNQGDYYDGETIQYNDLVVYDLYYVEYDANYGADLYLAFPGLFVGLENQSAWIYNKVAQYQDNGLPGQVLISPMYYFDGLGGIDQTKQQPIQIIFPNYEVVDVELDVTYEGILTPSTQIQEVLLSVDLGSDITSARAAVAEGTDAEKLQKAIENGSVNYTEFTASGNVTVDFGNNNPTGTYTAVVVAYIGKDVKNVKSVEFFYLSSGSSYDPNEGWESLGYVDYTDAYVCACPILFLNNPLQTYSLEMQESKDTPGLYRLVNPYGAAYPYSDIDEDNPYLSNYLYIDATNPDLVKILESPQEFEMEYTNEYNMIYSATLKSCWSTADYYEKEFNLTTDQVISMGNYYGKMANGRITFPAAYIQNIQGENYLSSGLLGYWEFTEIPEESDLYTANVVMDYDSFINSGQTDPYKKTLTGGFYNPFMVDMSKISKVANYRINGQVMLTKRGLAMPGSKKISFTNKFDSDRSRKETMKVKKVSDRTLIPVQLKANSIK